MKDVLDQGLASIPGLESCGAHLGFKYKKKDMGLIYFPDGAEVAGVFTQNLVQAHPVKFCQAQLEAASRFKVIAVNSGNANACNGPDGWQALKTCQACLCDCLEVKAEEFLMASTGVIGESFDVSPLLAKCQSLCDQLGRTSSDDFAQAILTTDTCTKQLAYQFDGYRIAGVAKGSGMIHPNMGTMLAFIATDADLNQAQLGKLLYQVTQKTFNRITVDGDSSTNDSAFLAATGQAGPVDLDQFAQDLEVVMRELAQMIVRDGEGATKFVTVRVESAQDEAQALAVAKSVATSNLVKTALYGEDANWGRVLAAAGYAEGLPVDPDRMSISFQSLAGAITPYQDGQAQVMDEDLAKRILHEDEVLIQLNLGLGQAQVDVWTCDFSHDYIKINAEYRS
ncbi:MULTISPECIES: bifunctional glutamate N-acetyltransferase/amino-acid acetyltransferase ArgJ [Aerococcus]|uniref:Arginine biosynthesis bifunctional protein ArgJ n=1 Tax=Aerococcus sanguinicola TaxID=119206 RepID=A0A5N1GN32_9LACT|nr:MULTISPECIES: bifunctional glutamate N-acetyltransferase/amino-acid acetyltransferase ArgJ [Aerococcus]KAA9301804.1 bifunctional glutamate N-acetyltransferase/amino-acid acetyltransferase ArgJ [Aerococcus sanguinicola]MDK6368776.1 bifunctional glutamate N-acetyltransferase/amino-acid acetyltransferase ArgJ [Aerococcus sp. UMB9870]MDK6679324.1 bifunctional glutamate N-acetyltransferase/amino-acid acetyltransferase ArgJ [Aerococcus sp. UMB8608]MDK6685834.1 bifunctional glutamate N-acetyltransf